MSNETRLLEFINSYEAVVNKFVKLLCSHLLIERENLMNWRSEGVPRTGFFGPDNIYKYSFHGIGCAMTFDDREIEFDFGYEGRLGGFDVWRLWKFAKSGTDSFPEFKDRTLLEKTFLCLIQSSRITQINKKHQDNLYYRAEG